jgi:tetratricopeptide (TPR) repeat protein
MASEIAQIDDRCVMSRRSSSVVPGPGSRSAKTIALERQLLARLGLSGAASAADIESAHDELVQFLEGAPHDLHSWADAQIAAADEAYALLSDPAADLAAVASPEDAEDEPEDALRPAPERALARLRGTRTAQRPRLGALGRVLLAAAGVVAAVTVGYAVYASGAPGDVPGINGTPAPESSQAAIDTARVSELMAAIQADPTDTASLQELGDIYFTAGDYGVAADWENRVLAIEPNDVTAHLALGAAQYNLGDTVSAEQNWRAVVAIDPANVEAHYDLGFLYYSAQPQNVAQAVAEWQQVMALAPDSQIAQTISTHLATLEASLASAAPPAGSSPSSPSGSPSAEPSPSTVPSPSGSLPPTTSPAP